MSDLLKKIELLDYPRLQHFNPAGAYRDEACPAAVLRRLRSVSTAIPRRSRFGIFADLNEIVMLVAFLEDRHVRILDIEKRAPLRRSGDLWYAAFSEYLGQAGCPYLSAAHPFDKERTVDYVRWLAGYAISLGYEEKAESINASAAAAMNPPPAAPASSGGTISPEAMTLVKELADMLHVSYDERDALHTLQAVHRAIKHRIMPAISAADAAAAGLDGAAARAGAWSASASAAAGAGSGVGSSATASRPQKGGSLAGRTRKAGGATHAMTAATATAGAGAGSAAGLKAGSSSACAVGATGDAVPGFPAGLETGDALLDAATAVLRMLYVADLRELQDGVNDILVTVQEFTAHPKTDASLGVVGR